MITRAQCKTPISIYVGDRDQFFTVESVRTTIRARRRHQLGCGEIHEGKYFSRPVAVACSRSVRKLFRRPLKLSPDEKLPFNRDRPTEKTVTALIVDCPRSAFA